MNYPQVLYQFPKSSGKPFQPSNGTEGMIFTDAFCMNCIHCDPDPNGKKQCMILCKTMLYTPKDKEYPEEWVFNDEGWPVCTNWRKWDWGNDGDPDDRDNPNYTQPDNPNQLCFPFIFDEIGIAKNINEFA